MQEREVRSPEHSPYRELQGSHHQGTLVSKEEQSMAIGLYADNFIPVVPADYSEHSEENPFCHDISCACHEDDEAIAAVNQAVEDGLMTPDEATDFVLGKLL
jgi:hypothetical protein